MKLSGHATAWSCATLLVVISLSQTLCKTPLLRIIELNICRSYYQNHNRNLINPDGFVQEKWCKIIPVQQELATVNGFYNFFATLIGQFSSLIILFLHWEIWLTLHRAIDGISLRISR